MGMINHTFRVGAKTDKDFRAKCKRIDKKPGDLMREMVAAFNDDRLTIQPVKQPYEGEKE